MATDIHTIPVIFHSLRNTTNPSGLFAHYWLHIRLAKQLVSCRQTCGTTARNDSNLLSLCILCHIYYNFITIYSLQNYEKQIIWQNKKIKKHNI